MVYRKLASAKCIIALNYTNWFIVILIFVEQSDFYATFENDRQQLYMFH